MRAFRIPICDCLCATGAAVEEMRVSGGGARSHIVVAVIANVTGVRVLRSSERVSRGGGIVFASFHWQWSQGNHSQTASEFPLTFEVFEPSGDPEGYGGAVGGISHAQTVIALWRVKEEL